MNNRDYITELLTTLKCLEKNYTVALTEASNEFLYQKYIDMFLKIAIEQRYVYELMYKKGFYNLTAVDDNLITDKL